MPVLVVLCSLIDVMVRTILEDIYPVFSLSYGWCIESDGNEYLRLACEDSLF